MISLVGVLGLLSTPLIGKDPQKEKKLHPDLQKTLDKHLENPSTDTSDLHPELKSLLDDEINDPAKKNEIHNAVDKAHEGLAPHEKAAIKKHDKKRNKKNKKRHQDKTN